MNFNLLRLKQNLNNKIKNLKSKEVKKMKGVKPDMLPVLVERYVNRVKTEAKAIVDISKMKCTDNPVSRLNVIAVIGPGYLLDRHYPEALLCEIGIHLGRPWHEANKPLALTHPGESLRIQPRHPWFGLTKDQYLLAAPLIFGQMQKIADQCIDKWKYGGSFRIPNNCKRFYRRQKKLFTYEAYKSTPKGITFSASRRDVFFLSDIYWAEMNLNQILKEQMWRIGNELNHSYRCRYKNGFQKRFLSLKIAEDAKKIMFTPSLKDSTYLLIESLQSLPKKEKHPLYPFIAVELLKWDGKTPKEKQLACAALPDPKTRVANIQLRVKNGCNGKRDYVSFVVYHSSLKT
jgi:hypothetical protein